MMNPNRNGHRDDRHLGGDQGRDDQRRHTSEWDRGQQLQNRGPQRRYEEPQRGSYAQGRDPQQLRGHEPPSYNPHRDEARDYRDVSFDARHAGSYEQRPHHDFDPRQARGMAQAPRGYDPYRERERVEHGYEAQGRPSHEWERDQRGFDSRRDHREFGGYEAPPRGYDARAQHNEREFAPVVRPRGDDWQSREQRALARDYADRPGYQGLNRNNPEFNRGYERENHAHEDDFRGGQPMGYRGQPGGYQGQHDGYQSREVDPNHGHQPDRGYGRDFGQHRGFGDEQRASARPFDDRRVDDRHGHDPRREHEDRGQRDFGSTYGPDRGNQEGRGGRDGIGTQQQFRVSERHDREEFHANEQRRFDAPHANDRANGNGRGHGHGNGRSNNQSRH